MEGGEYKRVFLLIDPYLWEHFGFLSEFHIRSLQFEVLRYVTEGFQVSSMPMRRCRPGHFLWLFKQGRDRISRRAVVFVVSQPFCVSSICFSLKCLDVVIQRINRSEVFLSPAGREKKELICCAVRNSEVLKRSSHSEHRTPHILSYRFRIFAVLKIINT